MQPEAHIPEQTTGAQSNTVAEQIFATESAAQEFYKLAKKRLTTVWHWHDWAGAASTQFVLTDGSGNEVQRPPQQGDYLKIDIPGPGCTTGDGFDWVRIEKIAEHSDAHEESLLIQVRPAPNPQNETADVAHFFSDDATSNFLVKRSGTTVSAAVHGRNEKPNVEAQTLLDKARNAAVATTAVAAFSKLQWKLLVNGIVNRDDVSEVSKV